jgi:hypothetical protein
MINRQTESKVQPGRWAKVKSMAIEWLVAKSYALPLAKSIEFQLPKCNSFSGKKGQPEYVRANASPMSVFGCPSAIRSFQAIFEGDQPLHDNNCCLVQSCLCLISIKQPAV